MGTKRVLLVRGNQDTIVDFLKKDSKNVFICMCVPAWVYAHTCKCLRRPERLLDSWQLELQVVFRTEPESSAVSVLNC